MKLPVVEGREVVPVRLIPFATQGFYEIGTVAIVSMLAGVLAPSSFEMEYCSDEEQAFCKSLVAYCRDTSGTYQAIKPVAWDRILCDVKDTRKAFGDSPDRKERLKQSIAAIPAGVFLWKTDFEKLWQIRLAARSQCKDERPGEREIDYGPMLDPGFSAVVWEGFEGAVVPVPVERPTVPVVPTGEEKVEPVGLTIEQIIKTPKSERSPLFAAYYEQRQREGADKELIAAEMWANNTCASYTQVDLLLNGPDAPGNDTRKCQRGKKLVEKGIELQKKMKLKKQVN